MFDELLLLTTALVGVALLRTTRKAEQRPRGYAWSLGGILLLTLIAVAQGSRFVGVVAIAMAVLVVIVPWLLEWAARWFFGRGMLRYAVWSAGARSMLMLGAGLGRQQEILRGLAVLESEGVDAAIAHFRQLAHDTEDGGELALINEQIVSMLLYGQRWDDGIRHYEARFHPRYAAMRPALVLGLLRAYGEVGQLERAAGLLRALEDGPVGNDPRALGLVSQARLTFLVYAGAAGPVDDALVDSGRRLLGLSEASGALFRGLAARQAGEAGRARTELGRVEELAGRQDDRVVESARRAISDLGVPPVLAPVEVEDDLQPYVEAVSQRLGTFVRAAPSIQRSGVLIATPILIFVMGLGYFAFRWLDHGGLGLLELGAPTASMIRAGEWTRVWTASWVHGDPIGLLLDLYTIWFAAPLVERVLGSARTLLIAVLGSAVGVLVGGFIGTAPGVVLGGGGPAACALIGAAILVWIAGRHRGMRRSIGRRIWLPFALVTIAQAASLVPGLLATESSWAGLLAAVVVGALLAMPPSVPKLRPVAIALLVAVGAVLGWSGTTVATQDMLAELEDGAWVEHARDGVVVSMPPTFEVVEERERLPGLPLPVQQGFIDDLAVRGGELAQVYVLTAHAIEDGPALVGVDASLDAELTMVPAELPVGFVEAYEGAGGDVDQLVAHHVRRNGQALGLTVARDLGQDVRVVLFAQTEALEAFETVYGRVIARARPQ